MSTGSGDTRYVFGATLTSVRAIANADSRIDPAMLPVTVNSLCRANHGFMSSRAVAAQDLGS